MKTILLDAGHSAFIGKSTTPGKRSPDWENGILYEGEFNRDVGNRIYWLCQDAGIDVTRVAPFPTFGEADASLKARVTLINELAKRYACILFSIHANAGGGEGFEAYTTRGNTKSDAIATILYEEMKKQLPDWKYRTDWTDKDIDKEMDFYIIKNATCPAVLSENGFFDNKLDYARLWSNKFREKIALAHFNCIKRIV